MLLAGAAYYFYEAYPFGWPLARATAGDEEGAPFEVVLHSVQRVGQEVRAYLTIRWIGEGPVPYFGFWGQWVKFQSGEEMQAALSVGLYRWQKRLERAPVTVTFPAPEGEQAATLKLRLLLEGRALVCELPVYIPDR